MIRRRRSASLSFAGYPFPREVILLAMRWYLRYGLSYRDVEELLAERGLGVDHVTIYRGVQRFTPLVIEAARPRRHSVGDRWFVDETSVRVAGVWRYVYRAVDQHDQAIDVYVSMRRNLSAATTFFESLLRGRERPREITTDLAAPLRRVVSELCPDVFHETTQYANNRIEWDYGRLKARLRPMRGLRMDRTVSAKEAAALLGIGRTMLYELIGRGELVPVHIGRCARFRLRELESFVDRLVSASNETAHPRVNSVRRVQPLDGRRTPPKRGRVDGRSAAGRVPGGM